MKIDASFTTDVKFIVSDMQAMMDVPPVETGGKQELDGTYARADGSTESGVFSNESNCNSSTDTTNSGTMNKAVGNSMLKSSDLRSTMDPCDVSTIEKDLDGRGFGLIEGEMADFFEEGKFLHLFQNFLYIGLMFKS